MSMNNASHCDEEFPQYNSFYEDDDDGDGQNINSHGNVNLADDHNDNDDDDDSTEIASFADATMQDISNSHGSFDNNIPNDSSYHSYNSTNSRNNNNDNYDNIVNNQSSTDDCLDALFEADTTEEDFFNRRKFELQEELQRERDRSKLELERLAQKIQSGGEANECKDDSTGGNEGNGVTLGKVNDYIGKLKHDALDNVALIYDDYQEDNDEHHGDNDENENHNNDNQSQNNNADDLSLDDEIDESNNIIVDENKSHQEQENGMIQKHDNLSNDSRIVQKLERDKKLAMLRDNYEALVAQQVTKDDEEKEDHDSINDINKHTEQEMNEHQSSTVDLDVASSYSSSLLYDQFKIGFDYIKTSQIDEEARQNINSSPLRKGGVLTPPKISRPNFSTPNAYQYPIIHFVDLTSSREENAAPPSIDTSPSSPTTQFKAWNRSKNAPTFRNLNLYSKINTILQQRHDSSLKVVKIKNLRTNMSEEIYDVKIQPQLNTSHISDPTEWHRAPLCHVYIAACASLDHYRTKVRPFLRAFVSQVDGAGSGNKDVASSAAKQAMKKELYQKDKAGDSARTKKKEQVAAASLAAAKAKDAAGSNATSKYMIIYVPVQPSCLDTGINQSENAGINKGGGILSRFGGSRRASNDVQSVKEGSNSNEWAIDDDKSVISVEHQLNPSIIRKLTKEQKDIFNKICHDFPKGKTCLLSSLLDKDNELAAESKIQNQEINEVLQTIGKVMVSGFQDRVQSYNNEIRKYLDEKKTEVFDWRHYFLVKESLALTYDQMRLPLESLKEYEDIEVKLPICHESWPPENEKVEQYHKVSCAALSGDSEAFREIMRQSAKDLANLSYFTFTYLFTRQARLLFQLRQPIALVERFMQHIKKIHYLRSMKCKSFTKKERILAMARIEAFFLDLCWEIKSTSSSLLSFSLYSDDEFVSLDKNEQKFVSSLLDLLNFARLRLFKFGDYLYTKRNNVRKALCVRPNDSTATWVPLKEVNVNESNKTKSCESIKANTDIISGLVCDDNTVTPWTKKAVLSSYEYENLYLEIADISIRLNACAGRFRCAARLATEQAECYILRKQFDKAAQTLLRTVDLSLAESWDLLLSWRLFRLIFCQRLSGGPPEYLRSITSCFVPKSAAALPSKFINLIIDDLEYVVNCPEVAGHTWGLSPFLGADVEFHTTKGEENVESSRTLNKNLYRNVCHIGDEVTVSLRVKSELPRAISVDEIKVTLVTYADYEYRHKSGVPQNSENAIILNVDSSTILTGDNTFKLPWTVMTIGQYVLESIQIKWKNAHFIKDYCTSHHPALCYDVLPHEPTQSIELNPTFLFPGHIQNVRLHFSAGSDIVKSGVVKIVCSKGVKVLEPDTEVEEGRWANTCSFNLDPCQPGEKLTTIVTVKCDAIESYTCSVTSSQQDTVGNNSSSQTLDITVTTSYHHKLYTQALESKIIKDSPPMSAILEANVTTLEYPALSMSDSNAYLYADNLAMIHATVNCNTPVPFSLKEWNITFPSCLALDKDGDLNHSLFRRSVVEGEELFFGFKCHIDVTTLQDVIQRNEQPILNVTLQDYFGKSFLQVLPLDIHSFYQEVARECFGVKSNATAVFSLASEEGLVGSPIKFTCDIDCSTFINANESLSLIYKLSCDSSDWIIAGQVRGTIEIAIENSNCSLEFVGIPVGAGELKTFPSVELMYESSNSNESRIKVTSKYPKPFMSLAHKSIETFAYLSLEEI